MGSGISAEECNTNSVTNDKQPTLDSETFKALQTTYESSKGLEDAELFDVLAGVYQKKLEKNESCREHSNVGVSTIACDEKEEITPERNIDFIVACGAFHKGKAKADIGKAKELYETGIDVNFVDGDGWSALFHACGEGHVDVVEWLTEECTANVELKDPEGCTPLWVAAFNNRRNIVQHLLRIGADDTIKAQPEGEPLQTPSFAARRNKHPGVADFIDDETALRSSDPTRRGRQMARDMTIDEFRDSLRKKGGNQAS